MISRDSDVRGSRRVVEILTTSSTEFIRVTFNCLMFWLRRKAAESKRVTRSGENFVQPGSDYYSLPHPLPPWPQGSGFATSRINLGELEVYQITKFEFIWSCTQSKDGKTSVNFYKPIGIPEGFFCLGHYCQSNKKPLRGFVLVAREVATQHDCSNRGSDYIPALSYPVDYLLVWSSSEEGADNLGNSGYFWLPQPPEGYKALGFLVTNKPEKPDLRESRCVRADLTDECDPYRPILEMHSKFLKIPLMVWNTRPRHRGIYARGVFVGTFYCSSYSSTQEEQNIYCLKNLDPNLHAMPNVDQIHALIKHYGPTFFFHPDEFYMPSSVSWFFRNGALLYSSGNCMGEAIDAEGSNLPAGGSDDGKYWIDLPCGAASRNIKRGNIESAKLYIHVKPAFGGTFTDVVMWIFCPFNGPGILKLGMMSYALRKVGQHVGDWEHVALRISNFSGELWSMYFSQHSGGEWVDASDLEFMEGNKGVVYASRSGHASFPHPGTYLQGSPRLGIGIKNDAARSSYYVDSSKRYEIVASEYLGDGVITEPHWLQYMGKWGPNVVYDSRTELDRIIHSLPPRIRASMKNIVKKLPLELSGEEGPTGPKKKNNWFGDERW